MEEKLKALHGQTLFTSPQQCPFDVEVSEDRVTFVPQRGKRTRRWESRKTILDAASQFSDSSQLRQEIQKWHEKTRNSSYIAVIVRELKK